MTSDELEQPDLKTLMLMITELQKTISALTSRLERYEGAEARAVPGSSNYLGRMYDPTKDRNNIE